MRLEEVVSGGQTGVDRAALDAAMASGLETGGWCPKGRRAEDGLIPDRYRLRETPSPEYDQRTQWNVRDSDATLILYREELSGGTLFTLETARKLGKNTLCLDLSKGVEPTAIRDWIEGSRIKCLNVAGPRESGEAGIYRAARSLLNEVFQ